MGKDADKNNFSELRIRAQTLLAQKPRQVDILQEGIQKLIHELDTYQIELELQNEDLRKAQKELEKSRHRYADLYDFAPIAYMTVSDKGMILETNLPDGTIAWQQWFGRALYEQAENVTTYQAVGRDITKEKKAEEKLKNEIQLRQLFLDALPCIAMLLQLETRQIVVSNKAAVAVGAVPGKKCYASWIQREKPCSCCLVPQIRSTSEPLNDQFWALGVYWDAYWIPVTKYLFIWR